MDFNFNKYVCGTPWPKRPEALGTLRKSIPVWLRDAPEAVARVKKLEREWRAYHKLCKQYDAAFDAAYEEFRTAALTHVGLLQHAKAHGIFEWAETHLRPSGEGREAWARAVVILLEDAAELLRLVK